MKHRINLYNEQLRPVKEVLSFKLLLNIWLVFSLLLSIGIASLMFISSHQQALNLQIISKLQQAQQTLTSRAGEFARRNDKAALILKKNNLLTTIQRQTLILDKLTHETEKHGQGYSKVFLALAELTAGDIWLTGISIKHSAISLHGAAIRSKDVLTWIEALNEAEALHGQDFSSLEIERQRGQLVFSLNNVGMTLGEVHDEF